MYREKDIVYLSCPVVLDTIFYTLFRKSLELTGEDGLTT